MSNPYNRTLTCKWADGEHSFRLGLKEIFELEAVCERGLGGIFRQIRSQDWHYRYVRETIRLGLIGAGMKPLRALQLVEMYLDEGAMVDGIPLAAQIIGVTLDPPEAVKKKRQAKAPSETRMSPSTPETSTGLAQ